MAGGGAGGGAGAGAAAALCCVRLGVVFCVLRFFFVRALRCVRVLRWRVARARVAVALRALRCVGVCALRCVCALP